MSEKEKQEIQEIAEIFKGGSDYMRGKVAGYAEALQMMRPEAQPQAEKKEEVSHD